MEKQLAEIYKMLANKIATMIPVAWSKLYYLGEIENGKKSWSSVFYFSIENEKNMIKSHTIPEKFGVSGEIYDELLNEVNELLLELYDCFQTNEQELWEQVKLFLDKDGKFNIDYSYDVINENDGGQVRRELVWAYETFAFLPKEGSYTRNLLNEYIANK